MHITNLASQRVQWRRRRAGAPVLGRMQALRVRLARCRLAASSIGRRVPGRVSPLERVMRRAAIVHMGRSLNAQLRVQLLLATGLVRQVEHLAAPQSARVPHGPVHAVTRPMRSLVTARVLHERLVERLTRSERLLPAPRASWVTRVEQRLAAPRIELTMVRQQPPVAPAATTATDASTAAPATTGSNAIPPRFAPPARPLVLPPQELSRLTDHVIRQLDHRVLSWQERTGRA